MRFKLLRQGSDFRQLRLEAAGESFANDPQPLSNRRLKGRFQLRAIEAAIQQPQPLVALAEHCDKQSFDGREVVIEMVQQPLDGSGPRLSAIQLR